MRAHVSERGQLLQSVFFRLLRSSMLSKSNSLSSQTLNVTCGVEATVGSPSMSSKPVSTVVATGSPGFVNTVLTKFVRPSTVTLPVSEGSSAFFCFFFFSAARMVICDLYNVVPQSEQYFEPKILINA